MLLYLAVPLRDDNDGCILLLYARRSSFRSMNIVLVKLDAQLLPLQASGALGTALLRSFIHALRTCPLFLHWGHTWLQGLQSRNCDLDLLSDDVS